MFKTKSIILLTFSALVVIPSLIFIYANFALPDQKIACNHAFSVSPTIAIKHSMCTTDNDCVRVRTGCGGCSCPLAVNSQYSELYEAISEETCNMKKTNLQCSISCPLEFKLKCNSLRQCEIYGEEYPSY